MDKRNFDGFLGKSDGYTTYLKGSKVIRRKIVVPTKPPSVKQLAQRQKAAVSNAFTQPLKQYINIAYSVLAAKKDTLAYALMTSHVMLDAIKGEYPNFEIDYPKVLFSKGTMPPTPGLAVRLLDNVLEFSWDTNFKSEHISPDDNAIFMIYFPESKTGESSLSAGERFSGRILRPLVKTENPKIMEIYFSFISVDRKSVSDSVYLGQMVLPALANKEE